MIIYLKSGKVFDVIEIHFMKNTFFGIIIYQPFLKYCIKTINEAK